MYCQRLLGTLASLAIFGLALVPADAPAQSFTKPVRIIVPFAPGGTSDILARLIGPKLQDAIGQPVVVENKTGAGGNIGADLVAKADKDGHTLLLIDISTLAISPNLFANMTYSPTRDLAPLGLILFAPYVLAVHPSLPVKTVPELVAHAKANPGKVPFGNAGIGVANHISAVQLEKAWGVAFKHVPYRGGADAIKGTVAGESQVILNGATATASFVAQGQLRGLAVSGDKRVDSIKELPSFKEINVTPADVGSWQGLLTTAGTPAPLRERLNSELNRILAMPDVAGRIQNLGGEVKAGPAADLAKWIESNTASFAAIIKEAGIKVQ
ncbi:MAG TPA: tripartite tricarboxylate transporter substrate binding protein [Xanthobacteraceae bacterium]|nr:tripartite tricarboxylate transporter substrate binding protein [Xanthobacteraceae bacterium]